MANPNEKFMLDEDGKIVVNDPLLAEALQELSPEELEDVAAGTSNRGCNSGCTVIKK